LVFARLPISLSEALVSSSAAACEQASRERPWLISETSPEWLRTKAVA